MDGPQFEEYNPTSAIKLWADLATGRPRQKPHTNYQCKESPRKRKVLIDSSSTEENAESEDKESC